MVVNDKNNFLHARIHPEMLQIKVSVGEGMVELTASNMDPVAFPLPPTSKPGSEVRVVRSLLSGPVIRVDSSDTKHFAAGSGEMKFQHLTVVKKLPNGFPCVSFKKTREPGLFTCRTLRRPLARTN